MRLQSLDRLTGTTGWRPDRGLLADLEGLAAGLGESSWRVELVWVEDVEMVELNEMFRRKQGVTDVLSFPNLTAAGEGEPALAAGVAGAATDLWWETDCAAEEVVVGEIVMAPRFVAERCGENDWDFVDELAMLTVHGILHLLGWDHPTAPSAAAMREAEAKILARYGRRHPLLDGAEDRRDGADGGRS